MICGHESESFSRHHLMDVCGLTGADVARLIEADLLYLGDARPGIYCTRRARSLWPAWARELMARRL